jgi:hypothetical protein
MMQHHTGFYLLQYVVTILDGLSGVLQTIFTGPPQGKTLELRAVALVLLLRHGTPPSALLRTFRVSIKVG